MQHKAKTLQRVAYKNAKQTQMECGLLAILMGNSELERSD